MHDPNEYQGEFARAKTARWIVMGILISGFILIPFAAVGARLEEWTAASLGPGHARTLLLGVIIAGLLGADIVLPVPSSIVSTAAGYFFGAVLGTLISFTGMTAACVTGYWIGAVWGRAAAVRVVGAAELDTMETYAKCYGVWGVAIGRPVPVLAEASVLMAGIARVPFRRFLIVSSLSNLGISLVYSVAGALSARAGSFFLALAAALLLPALAMLVLRRREAPRGSASPALTK